MQRSVRQLVFTGLFAALTAVGAFIRIPFAFSAFTLQFFFTAMAGVLLGRRYGALSQLVYVALGLLGLPIFTQGGGPGYFFLPTCGFLLGLIPAAWVIGALTKQHNDFWHIGAACLCGLGVLYLAGLPYMALILNGYMGKALTFAQLLMTGMLVFLPGDLAKIAVVGLLCPAVSRRLAGQVTG
jgi:biotin transport system substrate-specific component